MSAAGRLAGSDRRAALALGAVLFVSYAYFNQGGGWNQNSRFALVRAIVERHRLQIDGYQDGTGDRALWKNHYYSDKAPGASLIAVPFVAVARAAAALVRVDPASDAGISWTSYVATVATSGLFTLAAALLIFRLALRWGYSRGAALFAASAYGLASPAWCYATLYMGHGLTTGCLMLAFASAAELSDGSSAAQPSAQLRVGFWTGVAVLTELQSGVAAAFIVLLALSADWKSDRFVPAATRVFGAGLAVGLVFFLYNTLAFGSPLHIGYVSEEGFQELHTGFLGVTYPSVHKLVWILFGKYRGLLPLAPLMAVAPFGLPLIARVPARSRAAWTVGAVAAFYILFNASYFYWEGGWSYGPRQMSPALPFLSLGLAPLWDARVRIVRPILMAGWLWGAALTLVAVSTTPQPPASTMSPVNELLWPAFKAGDLSLNNQSFVMYAARADALRDHPELHVGRNLGEIAGLHGHTSLIPLGLAWAIGGVLLLLL